MRVVDNFFFSRFLYSTSMSYSVPLNLNYYWNFGYYATVCLVIQILTGVFLAMYYVPDVSLAFDSVEYIMRDVNGGWFLRLVHANGASMFFIVVYVHLLRGLYYGSYHYFRRLLWVSGVCILFFMILIAFLGYVLPWGQMSFWAATVITNLVSVIPYVGDYVVVWLWGGFSVSGATLNRFFSLHYFLPFVLVMLVVIHFIILHEVGSNNVLGVFSNSVSDVSFFPNYLVKDLFGVFVFFLFFSIFVFFFPVYLGHPDNYVEANSLVTPEHIVPEWYFLPFYAILRSVPNKFFGVLLLLFSILILFLVPVLFVISELRSLEYHPISGFLFFWFLGVLFALGWLGGCSIEYPYLILGQVCTVLYFLYFFFSPFVFFFERLVWFYEFV